MTLTKLIKDFSGARAKLIPLSKITVCYLFDIIVLFVDLTL